MKARFGKLNTLILPLALAACSSPTGSVETKKATASPGVSDSRAKAQDLDREAANRKVPQTPAASMAATIEKRSVSGARKDSNPPLRTIALPPTTKDEKPSTPVEPKPVMPSAPSLPPAPPAPATPPATPEPPPAPPEPSTHQVTIPAGTSVSVRMIDSVDSKSDEVGDTFRASLDAPVLINNQAVLPKGADAFIRLKQVQTAGNLRGKSELQLQLDRIVVGNKTYTLETSTHVASGAAQGAKAAKSAGFGAAIGAAIGAIAGGKKGAAVGAGAGAGAGVGIGIATGGEQVRVESETLLVFRLEKPLEITVNLKSPERQR